MKKIIGTILLCGIVFLTVGCAKGEKAKAIQPEVENTEATEHQENNDVTSAESKAENIEKADIGEYTKIIDDKFSNFGGELAYSLNVYGVGRGSVNAETQMKSASVIKLFIMEYAYRLMTEGEIEKDALIEGRKLTNLIEAMITVSDNNATNILIDYFTMEKLNEFFAECSYEKTKLQRRMLDTAAAARGEENYTSAKDVMMFLDKLYVNRKSYPYSEMLDVMKRQKIATKLRRNMPVEVVMASKTGELSDTENDVAIVFTDKGDYAIVCLTGGGSAEKARMAMAESCREIFDKIQQKDVERN